VNRRLEATRRAYNKHFDEVVNKVLGLSQDEQDKLSFEENASRIPDAATRKEYRSRAIQLLEENLRDHFEERPSALEAWRTGNTQELRDWQTVSKEWELALWELVEQSDAPRSSGAPTAGHQARSGGTRYIFTGPGLASCRRRQLSSNVRQHQSHSSAPHR
jgi:hypothetical protein